MPWAEARPVWQQAEALGAHTAWTYDHLTWRDLRDGPWYSALPLLTPAGGGPRAIAVAARHAQTWVTLGDPSRAAELDATACVEVVRHQSERLDAACEAIGRDPAEVDRLYMQGATAEPWLDSVEAFHDL